MICRGCNEDKPETLFRTDKGKRVGRFCKECCNKRQREYYRNSDYESHKEKMNLKTRRLRDQYPERQKIYYQKTKHSLNRVIKAYRQNSKHKGRCFELDKDFFLKHWQSDCYYCGEKLKTVGFDRIDNSKGYTVDNVVVCCPVCNRMRMALPQDIFLNKCRIIGKRFPDPNQEDFLEETT